MTHITIERSKLEQVLEALELSSVIVDSFGLQKKMQEAHATIKQARAAPTVQEPVGTYGEIYESMQALLRSGLQRDQQIYMAMKDRPLYTTRTAPVQEPVGVFVEDDDIGHVRLNPHLQLKLKDGDKLYTTPPAQPAPAAPVPLTDEQIQDVLTEAVRAGEVSWLGYKLDAAGFYTIPSLSPQHYQIFRAAEQAHGITAASEKGQP